MEQALFASLRYTATVLPVMAAAMFIMNMLQHSGLITRAAWLSRPLIRYGRLSEPVGFAFITAFGSPSAANAMLQQLHSKGDITKQELVLAVMANAFPVMVMEARYMLPVIVPLMGETGILIFFILLVLRFVQTMAVLTLSRFMLKISSGFNSADIHENDPERGKKLVITSLRAILRPMKRIILISVPVTFATFMLTEQGFFTWLSQKISFISQIFPVPMEGLTVIAAFMGHSVAGYTMAGNLLMENIIPIKDIVLTVLTAKVLSSIVFALRHTLPSYLSIFGVNLGLQILTATYLTRNLFAIGCIITLYLLW